MWLVISDLRIKNSVSPAGEFRVRRSDNPDQQFLIEPQPDLRPLRHWVKAKGGLPTVAQVSGVRSTYARRESQRATVDNLRLEPERRLVDQTGIEPVTS